MTDTAAPSPSPPAHGRAGAVSLVFAGMIALAAWTMKERFEARAALEKQTDASAWTSVVTVRPTSGIGDNDLVLPAIVEAYTDTPIYARTSGYLKSWRVDIGARVRAGDVLAEIETPEVDQQLRQAQADLATAIANARLAQNTAERWRMLKDTEAASRQETDEKLSDAAAKRAAVASAQAIVARLRDTQGFKQILAPYDGVITVRRADVGQLVDAGANAHELFHIAATTTLRVRVQVPQANAALMQPGVVADLRFPEDPGRRLAAHLLRTAGAIDDSLRTLLVELEVDNAAGRILPGAYAEAHFRLPARPAALRIPAIALLFRDPGLQVATLDGQDRVVLKSILAGRDFGTEVEVLSGLAATDRLIVNPPDSIAEGQQVHVVEPSAGHATVPGKQP